MFANAPATATEKYDFSPLVLKFRISMCLIKSLLRKIIKNLISRWFQALKFAVSILKLDLKDINLLK